MTKPTLAQARAWMAKGKAPAIHTEHTGRDIVSIVRQRQGIAPAPASRHIYIDTTR